MSVLGFAAAIPMGVSLGLLGGGGSILTLPILVYLLGFSPLMASAYSLLIVGFTALISSSSYFRSGQTRIQEAIFFALPSILSVYLTRKFLIPAMPANFEIIFIGTIEKERFIMLLFSFVIFIGAFFMLRSSLKETSNKIKPKKILVFLSGSVEGILTGIVGAGGGFLIVPALVSLGKLGMKEAVGTSLAIISIKSLLGFIGDLQNGLEFRQEILFVFLPLTILGSILGSSANKYFKPKYLKRIFAGGLLIMSITILLKEI